MNTITLKVSGIFLDLDGTLVDSTNAYIKAGEIAFETIGKQVPQNGLLLEIPRRIEQNLPFNDITQGDTKTFLKHYLKAYYSLTERKTKLIPNVADTLQILSRKTRIALITMRRSPNEVIYKELDYFGISKYFTYIITALNTTKPKPSPEALIQCAKELNLQMDDCIMVGDSVNDVRAGKAAGARTVALLSGLFRREELAKENPDLILSDVTFLPKFIE